MRLIGLTGGIGSGKTTVSGMLDAHGLVVVDADAITRELQQPGQPVLDEIVAHFGRDILLPDGRLHRQALADLVFPHPEELARLNAIVHPAVGRVIDERLTALAGTDDTVVLDVPLLVESGRADLELLVVVDLDPTTAVRRLVSHRGFTEEDARARISRQADRSERLARADIVIDNNGTLDDLARQVTGLVAHLTGRSA